MATIVVCDRCKRQRDVTSSWGRDLCAECVTSFCHWVDGHKGSVSEYKRSSSGTTLAAINRILDEHVDIAPGELALEARVSEQAAYDSLRHFKMRGLLVQPVRGLKRYRRAERGSP